MTLFAVHIADGILTFPWLAGGAVVAILLAMLGSRQLTEEEIPHVALLTAAFFVASLMHVRVGPTSVHLLLNGLVGVVLGSRAAVAIPIGLFLQAVLMQHGGLSVLGVNSCILVLPALLAWQLFALLRRLPWQAHPSLRAAAVGGCAIFFGASVVYSVTLLVTNRVSTLTELDTAAANRMILQPWTLAGLLALAGMAAWLERRYINTPEFPLGLLVGEVSVLATSLLNCLVLLWGGAEDWHTLALLTFVAHLPIAVVEGIVLGFTVGFLARVKPEMIGWLVEEKKS